MNQYSSWEYFLIFIVTMETTHLVEKETQDLVYVLIIIFKMICTTILRYPLKAKLVVFCFFLTVQAVENPTATEIQDVCSAVGLNVFLEVSYGFFLHYFPYSSH